MALPPYGSFGRQLRELRTARRLTMEELADASDSMTVTSSPETQ
jgi:transcriptional regulator with XRE-family HTH domain